MLETTEQNLVISKFLNLTYCVLGAYRFCLRWGKADRYRVTKAQNDRGDADSFVTHQRSKHSTSKNSNELSRQNHG
jgi:hypothetical protein